MGKYADTENKKVLKIGEKVEEIQIRYLDDLLSELYQGNMIKQYI